MISTLSRGPARLGRAVLAFSMVAIPAVGMIAIRPESITAWATYAATTERRVTSELAGGHRFLALDFTPAAAASRHAIMSGQIVVEPVDTVDARGALVYVPSAMVHHWRGAVLIPGAKLDDLIAKLQASTPDNRQEDVLDSKVLERGPDRMKVYLRVQRTKFVTVVYNTEHVVTFKRHGAGRASSSSTATKIAEVESPNTPAEHELAPGNDRGFLWRWNAYWRYEQVPGGVIAECESISLSRDIPYVVRYLVTPLINSTASESMDRTLSTLRQRHRR